MYRYIVQLMLHCSLSWTSCLRFLTKSPAIPQQLYKTASRSLSSRSLSAIAELLVRSWSVISPEGDIENLWENAPPTEIAYNLVGSLWRSADSPLNIASLCPANFCCGLTLLAYLLWLFILSRGQGRLWCSRIFVKVRLYVYLVVLTLVYSRVEFSRCQRSI